MASSFLPFAIEYVRCVKHGEKFAVPTRQLGGKE